MQAIRDHGGPAPLDSPRRRIGVQRACGRRHCRRRPRRPGAQGGAAVRADQQSPRAGQWRRRTRPRPVSGARTPPRPALTLPRVPRYPAHPRRPPTPIPCAGAVAVAVDSRDRGGAHPRPHPQPNANRGRSDAPRRSQRRVEPRVPRRPAPRPIPRPHMRPVRPPPVPQPAPAHILLC